MARKPKPAEQISEEGKHLIAAMNDNSDLVCVLVGVAALEQAVMSLLQHYFIDADEARNIFGRILGTYNICNEVAYALGLIRDKAFKNLKLLGTIRNKFAHSSVPVTFNDTEVKKLCKDLELPSHCTVTDFFTEEMKKSPRFRFQMVVMQIWNRTTLTALATTHQPVNNHPW
jgi:DNA-binding MltR family transcriptional regulator